jgi:hypothetical protein
MVEVARLPVMASPHEIAAVVISRKKVMLTFFFLQQSPQNKERRKDTFDGLLCATKKVKKKNVCG